jgi:hypothetical protein
MNKRTAELLLMLHAELFNLLTTPDPEPAPAPTDKAAADTNGKVDAGA